jgi:hypothetical protein
MEPGIDHSNGRQLNPFAFPAETHLRFKLLLISCLALAYSMGFVADEHIAAFRGLDNSVQIAMGRAEQLMEQEYIGWEIAGVLLASQAVQVGFVFAVVILAWVIYRNHPTRIRRQKKLQPFLQNVDPSLHNEIGKLASLAGISLPFIEIGENIYLQNGQAYGVYRKYIIGLGKGIRLLMRKAPQKFRVICLHEMAHIANGNIPQTYFAQAIWIAIAIVFVFIAISTGVLFMRDYILMPLINGPASVNWSRMLTVRIPAVIFFFFQMSVNWGIATAIFASVLRTREFYADWRAALWGFGTPLRGMLCNSADKETARQKLSLLSLHPSAKARLGVLEEPKKLFQISLDLPFQVGFLTAIIIYLLFFLSSITSISVSAVLMAPIPSLLKSGSFSFNLFAWLISKLILPLSFALLIIPFIGIGYLVSAVSIQVQREAAIDIIAGRKGFGGYLHLGIVALAIALGLEVGFLVMPISPLWPKGVVNTIWDIVILMGVTISTWICLVYVRYFSRRVLAFHVGTSLPKWKLRFITSCFYVLLGCFYFPLMYARVSYINSIDPEVQESLLEFIANGLNAGLILYVAMFSATWILTQLTRAFHPLRCPSCGKNIYHGYAVNRSCEYCNHDLSPWLFITPSIQTTFA